MPKAINLMHVLGKYFDKSYQDHNIISRLFLQTYSFFMFVLPCYATPISFALVPFFLLKDNWSFLDKLVFIYLTAEVGHYFYVKSLLPKLNVSRENCTMTQVYRKKVIKIVMELEQEPITVLKDWLVEQPEHLALSHFGEYIAWTCFYKRMKDYSLRDFKDSLEILQTFQKKTNIPLGEKTAAIPCLSPILDPVEFRFKPLLVYGLVYLANSAGNLNLKRQDFRFNKIPNSSINFWIYEPKVTSNKVPICLIHGAGIGLTAYTLLINILKSKHFDRKIILLDIPFTSSQIYSKIETRDEIIYAVDKMFSICNIFTCSWLAHSFGCSIATYICHYRSRYISKLSLAEPVNFRIWDARIPSYLFYMNPTSFTHSVFCFVVREPILAHTFSRNFIWHYNIIQPSDLQSPTDIYISKDDWLIDGEASINFLARNIGKVPHVHVTQFDTFHGGIIGFPEYLTAIIDRL